MAGFWSIIVPEATTNLVTNPSIFTDTSGFTAVGGSITRDATYMRRERSSLKVTPTAGVNDGAYYGTVSLTTGQSYTFSVDIKGTDGEPYTIYFANTGGTKQGSSTDFTATGEWERQEVTWACNSTASYRLYITKNNDNNTDVFYIDGVQCENLAYSTTYIDGNHEGGKWNGAEHASTSKRDAQSRLGGRVYNLDTYGFHVDDMPGIGMPPILHQTQEQPMLPGSLLRGSKTKPRVFDLIATQIGTTHEDLHSKRKDLLNAIKPDLVIETQPFILRYTGANAEKPTEIRVVYDSGYQFTKLEGFTERDLPLRFIAYKEPYFYEIGDVAQTLTTTYNLANANGIIYKDDAGWGVLGSTGLTASANALAEYDSDLYVGGAFSSAGGVADTSRIAKWDGSNWSALGTGGTDTVYTIVIAPDGTLYAGGAFTLMGGVANTAYIAKWNGSVWSALGTGMDNQVTALALDSSGNLYAGGIFHDAGGVTANHIAKWDGSAWSAFVTEPNSDVAALAIDKNDNLYAGGAFTACDGTTVNAIAKWDGSAWSALSSGFAAGGTAICYGIIIDPSGNLYAGGNFTSAGGVSANKIAKWNGASWSALGSGLNDSGINLLYTDGILYAGGNFTTAGGLALASHIASWNGYTWSHLDIDLPGSPSVACILKVENKIYIGFTTKGTATTSYLNTITNNGTRTAYPKIVIKRSGGTSATIAWIKNETTGMTLALNHDLLDGETLIFDFTEGNRNITSSQFGNIWQASLRSSDFANFFLLPGDNLISVFVAEVGSPTITSYMQWRNTHWSADGVAP